jgi:hypothetical protein
MTIGIEWIAGLFVSLVVGHFVTWQFLKDLRKKLGLTPVRGKEVPPWITGTIERLFFTVLVGFGVQGVPVAMMGWIGLKLASNWNYPNIAGGVDVRAFAMTALLGGLVSMLFAYLGGLICTRQFGTIF